MVLKKCTGTSTESGTDASFESFMQRIELGEWGRTLQTFGTVVNFLSLTTTCEFLKTCAERTCRQHNISLVSHLDSRFSSLTVRLHSIPLARKLKDCGVFGVSSDEFLVYARANREEWQAKGKEIVAEMMEELRTEQGLGGIISESEDPNEYNGGI